METLELLPRGSNEHVSHEEGMIRSGANDANVDAIPFVPSCKTVDDVNSIPGVKVVDSALSIDFPDL